MSRQRPMFRSDEDILAACQQVLSENGLDDWRVKIEDRQCSWGTCISDKKLIVINNLETWTEQGFASEKIMDTIYHEVAHALNPLRDRRTWRAEPIKTKDGFLLYRIVPGSRDKHSHNIKWARIAIRLGCKPEFGATEWQRKVLARALKEISRPQRRAENRRGKKVIRGTTSVMEYRRSATCST